MTVNQPPNDFISATCPACGMVCDDIQIKTFSPLNINTTCPKAIAFYGQTLNSARPQVAGKEVDLTSAIKAAAAILQQSHQPLFAGLGTEVQGMRAIIMLAEKTNATLDHMHSESTVKNTLTLQNTGWQTTTLTEIKNRADLIVAIGTDITSSHSRFFEKTVSNKDSLFKQQATEVVFLGKEIPAHDLPELINALNALATGMQLQTDTIAGISKTALTNLLDKIKASQYCVMVWAAAKLDFPHAELTIQSIARLIATLNLTSRVAGFPLNSGDGDTSVNNASTWLTGYTTRNRFVNGQVSYNNQQFSSKKQLETCDALLWVSTFKPHLPPKTNAPLIVIGHPNTNFTVTPDVFIPVSVPGLDQTGTMFRMDSAVALPLKKVRENTLKTLSQVLQQIAEQIA